MNILVTGGTGFIGSHLAEALIRGGDRVRTVAKDNRNSEILAALGVEVVLGDLNNGLAWGPLLAGVECVYHLAGVTRAKTNREYYEGNSLATKRFLGRCAEYASGLRRFVYVSSQAAAGPSPDGRPLTEEAPCHPVSDYGWSKMLAEREVWKFRDAFPVTIIRPSAAYGPRDRDMLQLVMMIKKRFQPVIGFGRKWLNVVHVRDLVAGLVLAGRHPRAEDELFFIGHEQAVTTEELGSAIAVALQASPIRLHLPHWAAYVFGAVSEALGRLGGRQVLFNLQKVRESVQESWLLSVEKAGTRLGFRPRIPLAEGMQETCAWYAANGWLN
jgi:nucleoside-diphosphate-sugar epimerase